jgi:nucleoside-diphosphate-sugar epimerase
MSGGAEANFELGWSVNVDANVNLLKATHEHAKEKGTKPIYVFVSSMAVYGGPKCLPENRVIPADTPPLAQSSYGIQKQIMELYVYDYGRRGFLDTRSIRLPTVAIRAGAPTGAASSFISDLIREPLLGNEAVCPIADSIDDKSMDTMPVYLTKASTAIRNIAYALCMPESKFKPGLGRSVNMPGISISPRGIINAL